MDTRNPSWRADIKPSVSGVGIDVGNSWRCTSVELRNLEYTGLTGAILFLPPVERINYNYIRFDDGHLTRVGSVIAAGAAEEFS